MMRMRIALSFALLVATLPAWAMYGFQPPQTYLHEGGGVEWEGEGVLVRDVNGDALDDVILAYSNYANDPPWHRVAVFLQDPATHQLSAPTTYPIVRPDQGRVYVSTLQEADINGDGKKDIIIGHSLGFSVLDPAQDFAIVADVEVPGADTFEPMLARAADINGDGYADVVFVTNDTFEPSHASLYIGDGHGGFSLNREMAFPDRSGFRDIRLEDLNNDGHPDLVVFSQPVLPYAGFDVYYNDGSGNFSANPDTSLHYGASNQMAVGDLDGDGRPDLIGGSQRDSGTTTSYGIRAYLRGRLGRPYLQFRTWRAGVGSFIDAIRVQDMDVDGRPDLLFSDSTYVPAEGNFRCYINYVPSAGAAIHRYLGPCTSGPDAIAAGDINGDGLLDLVGGDAAWGLGWALGTHSQGIVNLVVGEGFSANTAAFTLENGSTNAVIAAPSVELTYSVNRGRIDLADWPQECSRPDPQKLRLVCNYPDLAAGQGASGIVHYAVLQSQPYMQLHATAKATTTTEETVTSDNTATAATWIRQL